MEKEIEFPICTACGSQFEAQASLPKHCKICDVSIIKRKKEIKIPLGHTNICERRIHANLSLRQDSHGLH